VRRQAKVRGHAGRHISEPNVTDGPRATAETDDWHSFAGMLSASEGGVIAVIGSEDRQIIRSKARKKFGQSGIEPLKSTRVASDIAGVAIKRVEFDEIGKCQ
jgi:hypothetical protein